MGIALIMCILCTSNVLITVQCSIQCFNLDAPEMKEYNFINCLSVCFVQTSGASALHRPCSSEMT